MSLRVTLKPRSVKSSRAARRIRWRLRSASLRSGRSTVAMWQAYQSRCMLSMWIDSIRFCGRLLREVDNSNPFLTGRTHAMSPNSNPHHTRRWAILAVLGIAQLMVVLDATVVNIALPSAQRALHFSNENRQWIITAYALTFGSLLLLRRPHHRPFPPHGTFPVGPVRL